MARERVIASREIETEKARTELAQKETAMERERAEFYRQAFADVIRGPSFGCLFVKWVFTFGKKVCT